MALNKDMTIPEHMVLTLDENGRWAEKWGLPRTLGHREGCVTTEKAAEIATRIGVRYLTVYGFFTEGWKRPAKEVGALVQPFRYYMVRLLRIASTNNMRTKTIGDRSRFDRDIIDSINHLGPETQDNTGLAFVIAINYGGRNEARRTTVGLTGDCALGKVDPDQVGEVLFTSYLDTAGMPDPDLLTRTNGELRPSDYLLRQLAYTGVMVMDCLWLDFSQEKSEEVIMQYNKRERWFSAVK